MNTTLFRKNKRLSWLSTDQLDRLAASSRLVNVPRSDVIYTDQEASAELFILLSGVAALTLPRPRRRVLVGMLGPGDVFGLSALFPNARRRFRCDSLAECKVATIEPREFTAIMCGDCDSVQRTLGATFQRWESMLSRYATFMDLDARGRIAFALLELAEKFGVTDSRGVLLPMRFSHARLAELVGVSRQQVTMQMQFLHKSGAVSKQGSWLTVSPERLRAAAQ
jgi:CRP/FNR family cyclic AMP-dependent transcriptional regulator